MSDTHCPFCGDELFEKDSSHFKCGTFDNLCHVGKPEVWIRTELCREREAHNKTKRERDEARENWGTESMNAADFFSQKTKAIAERDDARKALAKEKSNHDKTFLQLKRAEGKVFLNVERAEKLESENAKLREIAEAAIMCASLWGGSRSSTPRNLRSELDQLTEGGE